MAQSAKTILIIEDEIDLRNLYVQILEKEGFVVEQAADGEEGYMKLSKKEYDLLLLDIILPKLDGLQILDKLKSESKKLPNKVVLLTNLSQELIISKAVGYGIAGYIVKSDVTPDQIVTEVKSFLGDDSKKTL